MSTRDSYPRSVILPIDLFAPAYHKNPFTTGFPIPWGMSDIAGDLQDIFSGLSKTLAQRGVEDHSSIWASGRTR